MSLNKDAMLIWVKLVLGSMRDATFTIIPLDQTVTNVVAAPKISLQLNWVFSG